MPELQETASVGSSAGSETPADTGGAQTTQNNTDIQTNGASGATLSNNQPEIAKGTAYNVLHNYRSWNYIFTISALTPDSLSEPDNYKAASLKYVIAKSSGKGSMVIDNKLSSMVVNTKEINAAETIEIINGFNRESPGRFDFSIDNVEISTLMASSSAANLSLPTKIKFDILEPYSMGGFLEALEASSRAVGAVSYAGAIYVLKIEFWGYRDSDNINEPPREIEGATRYFPMLINKVEVEAADTGTMYRCQATPVNEMGFGETNKIRTDIKMTGSTVGECLNDFFKKLNSAVKEEAEKIKGQGTKNYDEYEIVFMPPEATGKKIVAKRDTDGSTSEWKSAGSIYSADINKELRGAAIYKFPDPKTDAEKGQSGYKVNTNDKTNTPTIKYNPTDSAIMFPQGAEIHEIITNVIRDSEYTKNLIAVEIEKAKKGNGFVTYWLVRVETEFLEKNYDPQTLKRNQKYRYVVQPYRIHYTRLPGEQLGIADFKGAMNQIQRTYDYLYMGKNKDVINFNLKFNHLYFQAIPPRAGNKDTNDATRGAGSTENPEVSAPIASTKEASQRDGPVAPMQPTVVQYKDGPSGQSLQSNPYHQIAKTMHEAVLQSVDLAKMNIEIYGDPYYIVTGGIGNQTHKIVDGGLTENGENPIYACEPYVNINFRTPVDIGPDGKMSFEKELLPFSGIYRVISCNSSFSGGVFKQKLVIIRMPGQLVEAKKVSPSPGFKEKPKPGEQITKDKVPAGVQTYGIKPNDFTLANLLGRGLPSPGLPGVLSNFTNAAGGAGIVGAVTGALTSVAGVAGAAQNLIGQVGHIAPQLGINIGSGLTGVNALASGIRLASSGVSNIVGGLAKAPSATVNAASNIVGSAISIPNAGLNLASNVSSQVGSLGGSVAGLTGSAVNATKSLGSSADSLMSGVSGKIDSLKGTVNDPTALAASVGIDPSQLSGLDPSVLSKVTTQLASIKDSVPDNVDIGTIKNQGVIMSQLTGETLKNLPPVDAPNVDTGAFIKAAKDSASSLASAAGGELPESLSAGNVPNITNVNLITNKLGQAAGGLSSGLGDLSVASLTDKLSSAQGSLNSVVAAGAPLGLSPAKLGLGSVESNASAIGSLVQGSAGAATALSKSATSLFGSSRTQSPLDKLIANNNADNNNWGEG